jgi:hypothetical protein
MQFKLSFPLPTTLQNTRGWLLGFG